MVPMSSFCFTSSNFSNSMFINMKRILNLKRFVLPFTRR
jgi:hypothetical protein